ncbi:MAG TPA: hemerythrin domain-containing protein [Acidimicrobiales bacterium]|nr:hemerythrin domain-containing protein [Acidimicrobiales bacterium]
MNETTGPDQTSITDLIRGQHVEIERLFTNVQGGTGDARREAFECLVRLLAVHETAEEEVVYPVVRHADPTGDEIVDARTAEESDAKSLLAELERLGPDHEDFPSRFDDLRVAVLEHAHNEETTVLPLLERTQDERQLAGMGVAARAAEALAPTHPHPHGPESALGNLAVGPMVAVVDRARDAIRAVRR